MTDTTTPASTEGLRPVLAMAREALLIHGTYVEIYWEGHTPKSYGSRCGMCNRYYESDGHADDCPISQIDRALSASPASGAAVAEPVAWAIYPKDHPTGINGAWLQWTPTVAEADEPVIEKRPLYLAPPSLAAAVEQATAGMRRKLIEAEEDAKCSREFLEVADRRFQVALRQLFDERTARIEAERRVEAMREAASKWANASDATLRLHGGEMSAQECRTVRAFAGMIARTALSVVTANPAQDRAVSREDAEK